MVRELLDAGADPRLQNGMGQTPLILAAMSGNCEVVNELLREDENRPGCSPALLRQRNSVGLSAIMIAHMTALKSGVVTDLLSAVGAVRADVVLRYPQQAKGIQIAQSLELVDRPVD